MHIVELSIQQ